MFICLISNLSLTNYKGLFRGASLSSKYKIPARLVVTYSLAYVFCVLTTVMDNVGGRIVVVFGTM